MIHNYMCTSLPLCVYVRISNTHHHKYYNLKNGLCASQGYPAYLAIGAHLALKHVFGTTVLDEMLFFLF